MHAWDSIKLRLDRADHLLRGWDQVLTSWIERVDPVFENDYDPSTGISRLLMTVEDPPMRTGLLLSEAAHHMRAALDNALFAAVPTDGLTEKQLRRIQFPVVDDLTRLRRSIADSLPKDLSDEITSIIHDAQPFAGTKWSEPISHLHNLNRFDKHRILQGASIAHIKPLPVTSVTIRIHGAAKRARQMVHNASGKGAGTVPLLAMQIDPPSVRVSFTPNANPDDFDFPIEVFFGDPPLEPFEIDATAPVVREICESLRPHFQGTQ